MKKKRAEWTVSLYRCNVGKKKGKTYPRVIRRGTVGIDQLAERVVRAGSEISKEILVGAANLLLEEAENYLLEGYAVSTPLGTLSPGVSGMWNSLRISEKARNENKAHLNYAMSNEMKKKLATARFFEEQPRNRLIIDKITDLATGRTDGWLTAKDSIMINGDMLLMNGDLPERGVYFIDPATQKTIAFIPATKIMLNTRTQMLIRLPEELQPGQYLLKIASQCTTSPRPMKTAKTTYYRLTVEVSGNNSENKA